jgi:hypothetical protein
LCDLFDLTNIIKEPTCFKKDCNPSLVDVILTNESKSGFKSLNFNTGVSDCHHFISTFIKGNIPICENIKQPYRSFKNVNDLDKIHLLNESCDNVTDIDTEYDHFECEVSKVIDKHVPVKHCYPRKNPVPYMNRDLRKAIYNKQMLRNKYEKYHTDKTWGAYRKQRNLVTKLKKKICRNIVFREVYRRS